METVAVYLEDPVRVYALKVGDVCALLDLDGSPGQLAQLTAGLEDMQPPLALVFLGALWWEDALRLQVCLPLDQADCLERAAARAGAQVRGRREASVINLQGPHFGDRWGLAKDVLAGLEDAQVEPLSLLGVTHTLQTAIRPQDSQAALAALAKRFKAPEGSHG